LIIRGNSNHSIAMASSATPIDIARETIKALAVRRLSPTPDNYRALYEEIAGEPSAPAADGAHLLGQVLHLLGEGGYAKPADLKKAEKSLSARDWPALEAELAAMITAEAPPAWADLVGELIKQWERKQSGLNLPKKHAALERVLINFGSDPRALYSKLQALVQAWAANRAAPMGVEAAGVPESAAAETPAAEPAAAAPGAPSAESVEQLREIVSQSLLMGVVPRISQFRDLVEEATGLAESARGAKDELALRALSKNLKQFWIKLALRNETDAEVLEGLLRLLRLLVENIGELMADDQWLHGQVEVVRDIISQPINLRVIYDAEQGFKEVLYKQGVLRQGLHDAKETLKTMVASFIDRLGEMTATTDVYHQKIERYATEIGQTNDITQLNRLLGDLMADTKGIQLDIQRSRDELEESRRRVVEAEDKVRHLEAELDEVSAIVKQDHLTGALNRRGMGDAFEQEMARADRTAAPLSVAIMDVDHFKRLNDTYGHDAGDNALIHLVNVVKDVIRPTDLLARFGGEEFVLLLPATEVEEGVHAMMRVQRELTKRFFLHDNQKVLITFSCGVARWRAGETADQVIARADQALYRAKEAGRNRVLSAEP
jgi:diguanylate cyclase (GGDEF) domain